MAIRTPSASVLTLGGLAVLAVLGVFSVSQLAKLDASIGLLLTSTPDMPSTVTSSVVGAESGITHVITSTQGDKETNAEFTARHVAKCLDFQTNG